MLNATVVGELSQRGELHIRLDGYAGLSLLIAGALPT
jgi:hypothetical protein